MTIEKKIENTLNKIRPYLENDGGNIQFIKYENNIAYVKLTGACSNCEMIDYTLKDNIEEILVNEIPEIFKVINIKDE